MKIVMLVLGGALLCGCAAHDSEAPAPAASQAEASILVGSEPAAGSKVRAPVDELRLRFNPPARLDEIVVSGPGGDMPAMVHALGEVADYSIPLSGLGPGAYSVNWRATSGDREYRGSFAFIAR